MKKQSNLKKIPYSLRKELKAYCLKKIEHTLTFYSNKEYLTFDYDLHERTGKSKHSDIDLGLNAKNTLNFVKIIQSIDSGRHEETLSLVQSCFENDGSELITKLNNYMYE